MAREGSVMIVPCEVLEELTEDFTTLPELESM
jgi:hypothetical protein